MINRFIATIVLGGAGDALGYHLGYWEFNNLEVIKPELDKLGGVSKACIWGNVLLCSSFLFQIELAGKYWIISDDTIMQIASATGAVKPAKTMKEMIIHIYREYCDCMAENGLKSSILVVS